MQYTSGMFRCHTCGGKVAALAAPALKSLVGSDCTPVTGELCIGVCEACGLVQKEISAAWSDLCKKIYGNYRIYHQADGEEQKARGVAGGELKARSELVAGFLSTARTWPNNGAALDIGCGNGPFLRAMNKVFPGWSLTGTDLNNRFRDRIESIGPRVSFRRSEDLSVAGDTYDVVSLNHCIEHIPAPAHYLADAKRYINNTGLLLIEVPDAELNPFDLVVADHCSTFPR